MRQDLSAPSEKWVRSFKNAKSPPPSRRHHLHEALQPSVGKSPRLPPADKAAYETTTRKKMLPASAIPAEKEFRIVVMGPCVMPDHSVHKAADLAADERLIVERWLGRPLASDETISVNVYRPRSAPTGDELENLRREILTQAREIGSRVQDASEKDVEALVDEAFAVTRGKRG